REPYPALRSVRGAGRVERAALSRIKTDRVAPVAILRNETFSLPARAAVMRDKDSTKICRSRTRFVGADTADPQMRRIEGVDCNHPDSRRNARARGWREQIPTRATIYGLINSNTSIRVDRQVRFAGAAIDYSRIFRIN